MEHWKTQKTEMVLDSPWVKVRRDAVAPVSYTHLTLPTKA